MKKILVSALVIVTGFAMPVASSMAFESSAYAAVTSNYVFRGLSGSNNGVAGQGGYDIQQSKEDLGWFAGAFASSLGDLGSNGLELDVYGGWKGDFNKALGYEVGGIYYKYSDINGGSDTTEIYAGLNYETAYLKIFSASANGGGKYNYLDLGATFVVLKDIDLNVHYGHYSSSANNYNDLGASMNMEVKDYDLALGLTYQDNTNKNNLKFIATVTKTFDF